MGQAEISDLLKISRARAYDLARNNSRFPKPVAHLRAGPIFCAVEVHDFLRTWTRKPGRPKK